MLTYHFTNDTRFDDLETNLISVANHIANNEWYHPDQTFDQAKNGWYHVYTLYFGLYKGSNNIKLILDGKIEDVIIEFIKKFQFPNPRKVIPNNAMTTELENGQELAPLRHLIKLLFYKSFVEKTAVANITKDQFERYILLNESVAKNEITIEENYYQLSDDTLAGSSLDYEYFGGDKNRFISQMLGILNKLPFVSVKGENISLILSNLTKENKIHLFDIISYDDFWKINQENSTLNELYKSYQEYIQVELQDSEEDDSQSRFKLDSLYNVIYYGAPGTGKSYTVTEKIKTNYPNFIEKGNAEAKNIFRTTLHPEFSYNDFVGQIMPTVTDEGTEYKFSPGVFTLSLKRALALEDTHQPVYLVLEELSRANVSAVFGDLFQLLDRDTGKSEYTINNPLIAKEVYQLTDEDIKSGQANTNIYLPNNLYIYGTVNTNDQNVFVMDTAFKRRFDWIYISTKPENEKNNPEFIIVNEQGKKGYIHWHTFYQKLNNYITKEMRLGEDKQVGQFFIKFGNDEQENKLKIQNKLLQYLWDDIDCSSFNGKKLFNSNIANYADLYEKFGQDEFIFSEEFINRLEGEATITYFEDKKTEISEGNHIEATTENSN